MYNKIKCDPNYILDAFDDLILNGLLSKEYYENKGHKVLGKIIESPISYEIIYDVKNDIYDSCYVLAGYDGSEDDKWYYLSLYQIFVGSYKAAIEHVEEIKKMLAANKTYQDVVFEIKKPIFLTIKRKWFDMILDWEKREEYREIKPYYTSRFLNAGLLNPETLEPYDDNRVYIRFRNGYSKESPECIAIAELKIKEGNPEWGAEPNKKYYTFDIQQFFLDAILSTIAKQIEKGEI